MGLNEILLTLAALLPAVILCVYVYKKDRADKEPVGLLLLLLLFGVLICFPASVLELLIQGFIDLLFAPFFPIAASSPVNFLYQLSINTVGIALVEEGLKWVVLLLVAKKTRHFNSLFDGIIYAVFISLGFAAFENVLYVLENGWMNALMRGLLAVPAHMFFAVLMGFYFSSYSSTRLAHQTEVDCRRKGILPGGRPEFSEGGFLALSLLVPTLAHGLYDFCLSMDSWIYTIAFYALVILLYIYCFGRIKITSKQDTHILLCALKQLDTKYPGFADMVARNQNGDGDPNALLPTFPLMPAGVTPSAPNVRFAGIYTKTPGIVHIVAPVKQPLPAGSTLVTVQTALGQTLPIISRVECQVDKYDIREGDFVSENKLLGVMKYTV